MRNVNTNPQQTTGELLLFIRGTHWNHGMSPAQFQHIVTDFYGWIEGLSPRGILKGARPLVEEGKLVSGTQGRHATDGVFDESKDSIADMCRPMAEVQQHSQI